MPQPVIAAASSRELGSGTVGGETVCASVGVSGTRVEVGGGGFAGREGELNNRARAGERFGWLWVNRVGSRLRRHSVLSTRQIVLLMAGVKAGAWVVDQVWVPPARKFVQASKVWASLGLSTSFLVAAACKGCIPNSRAPVKTSGNNRTVLVRVGVCVNPFTFIEPLTGEACEHAL